MWALNGISEIFKYTFKYKGTALLVVICNLLFTVFNLLSLVLFIPVLQLIFRDPKTLEVVAAPQAHYSFLEFGNYIKDSYSYTMYNLVSKDPKEALLFVCLTVFLAFFLKNLFRYGAVWFQSQLRMAVVRDVRDQFFKKVLFLPLAFHTHERKGDLMARMNSDVGEIEIGVVSMLELIFREPLAILINIFTLIYLSPKLTLISLFLLPITAFIISRISKGVKKTAKAGQEQTGILFSAMDESLNGIKMIKAFGAIDFMVNRFKSINLIHQKLITKTFRKKDLSPLLNETIGALIMLLLVWFGGNLILDKEAGSLSGEVFLTFIIVFSQLLRPIQGVASAMANLAKARVSLDRINEVLDENDVINEVSNPTPISSFQQEIVFNEVTFSYKEDTILNQISFSIKKGETVAIVGESGSGKSTLLNLLPRFYDPQGGFISIDGHRITDLKINDLRGLISMVDQDSLLFNASVIENIAFGDDTPNLERAIEASKTANAFEFIMALENGFQTNIGEKGNKLSGGQKQRISIARALYKDPQILLLDEATSSLDTESELQVQQALEAIMAGKTSLIVAHRLSTVQKADRIMVFQKGSIVETGTHQELIKKNGFYARFCKLQGIMD